MAEDTNTHATPERAGRAGDQPLPTPGIGGDVIQELIDRVEARRKVGIARYGRPLQAFNGRHCLRDLLEELLDAAAYTLQAEREEHGLEEAVLVLARQFRGDQVGTRELEAALLVSRALERKRDRLAGQAR